MAVLIALFGAMLSARLVRHALTESPRDRAAFAELWAVHLPIDDAACRSIGRSADGRGMALARVGVADPLQIEEAVRKCVGGALPTRRVRAVWLDLELWESSFTATPR